MGSWQINDCLETYQRESETTSEINKALFERNVSHEYKTRNWVCLKIYTEPDNQLESLYL